ncbi:UNVERIFIED_ORG: trigger factor [Burkholderia sp. 1263]
MADEITLLCKQHHGEKENGLLPKEVVEAANQNPFNLRNGVSKPYLLHYSGSKVECVIGNTVFRTRAGQQILVPLMLRGEPVLKFDLADGHLLLSLTVYDEDENELLRIDKNELVYSMLAWDITLIGRTLRLRQAERHINIEIEFIAPNKVHIRRGIFHKSGAEVLVGKDYVYVTNNANLISSGSMEGVDFGIVVGDPHPTSGCGMLFRGQLPSLPDRETARRTLRRRLKSWRKPDSVKGSLTRAMRAGAGRVIARSDIAWYLVFPERFS